jgi:hypothetical protein
VLSLEEDVISSMLSRPPFVARVFEEKENHLPSSVSAVFHERAVIAKRQTA